MKLKAFIATAEAGNFSEAARNSNVSPSVMMKRVNELEFDFNTNFFDRSTRGLTLTDNGSGYLNQARELVRSYNDLVNGAFLTPDSLEGPIRVKAPAASIRGDLRGFFSDYCAENPLIQLDIYVSDAGGNPSTEGFDIAVGMDTLSYTNVLEKVIKPFPRLLCASPDYLAKHEAPQHPHDLLHHPCLTFSVAGSIWAFSSPQGRTEVDVSPMLMTNDDDYLCAAACAGRGIVQLALPSVAAALEDGRLVPVLEEFPLVERWLKIMAPKDRLDLMRVGDLFDKMIARLAPPAG